MSAARAIGWATRARRNSAGNTAACSASRRLEIEKIRMAVRCTLVRHRFPRQPQASRVEPARTTARPWLLGNDRSAHAPQRIPGLQIGVEPALAHPAHAARPARRTRRIQAEDVTMIQASPDRLVADPRRIN